MAFESPGALAHAARALYRCNMLAAVEKRRHREFEGLHVGPNYEWLHKYQATVKDPLRQSAMKRFITGSFLCKERQYRHSRFQISPRCMLCQETETIPHIIRECRRHCWGYHRTYLSELSELSAERLSRNGIPLLSPDIVQAGYPAYEHFMNSAIAALLQRDIDNAHFAVEYCDIGEAQGGEHCVRRRLRGKQPVPAFAKPLRSMERPATTSRVRKRLVFKQPRPLEYEHSNASVKVAKAYNTACTRFLASIRFEEDGFWRVNNHQISLEGTGPMATLTCVICGHRKLWKWRHLWACQQQRCKGPRVSTTRAKRSKTWITKPGHIDINMEEKRLTCTVCEANCSLKHLTRFVTRHTKCA
eukprot:996981-Amphidinium_carterae.2